MTYGWAILIIVIVAVILYSMGIFNPSSSVTFTSSGFSPFTVSSSLCNNIGYKIAVLAGPIPNNANSLTINKVFLTSATGANTTTASYTLTNPVTLKSGQSATILIPNVACNSANIHYSLSAKIQYSYDVPTIGLQNVNTTGTVAGTSITGKPSTLTSYEPITITNTQSSATPSPFQQMINFTSSDPGFSLIATGNFGQNVEFFYSNGTVIPSWLENYISNHALWWLKLGSIPAGSSQTLYMGFAPTSTNLFNTVNDGEAPQIPCGSTPTSSCSNYAEYDDGANVFMDYWNFNGTSLPSYATILDSPNVNNGLIFNNSDHQGIAFSISLPSSGAVVESGYSYPDSSALGIDTDYEVGFGYGGFSSSSHFYENGNSVSNFGGSNSGLYVIAYSGGNQAVVAGPIIIGTPKVNVYYKSYFAFGPNGVLQSGWDNSYLSATDTTYSLSQVTQVFVWQSGVGSPHTVTNWFRVRAYPPNGVMPSVSFGGVA